MKLIHELILTILFILALAAWVHFTQPAGKLSLTAVDYALLSRTNIVAVKGPSQIFFTLPNQHFILYDWENDRFFEPQPYIYPIETPKLEENLRVTGDTLTVDAAANLAYARYIKERTHYVERYASASAPGLIETRDSDVHRRVTVKAKWFNTERLQSIYEESIEGAPRIAIDYYFSGGAAKVRHFNSTGLVNGGAYEFYEDGRLKRYAHFFEGRPMGPYLEWNEQGALTYESFMSGETTPSYLN
ncbi:MAG: hypothetical protein GC154_04740 [bacterium]|nr:hypothetical protein [bacterium]